MAYDGTIRLDTGIDNKGVESGLKNISTLVIKGAAAATAALSGLATAAIKVGSDFEAAMSQVAATMGTTIDQIPELTALAKEMGAATQFSASQAAAAINNMAMAGYDASTIMSALPQVLDLAAAGALDLDYATQLAANGLNVFGLGVESLGEMSDKLAVTASSAYGSVADFGEGLLIAGGQAKLANLSLTETFTALGVLGDNGISAAEGGTALRNVLKNLYTPTSQAAKAMAALGVETVDADGDLRNVQDVLQDMGAAMDNLTEADRMQAMADIFDTRTIAAANALLKDSGDRWDELSAKIDNAEGAAAAMARTMNDNLQGDIIIMQSALEGLGVSFYEGISAPLRDIVQTATESISTLSTALQEGGISGLVSAIGDILAEWLAKIVQMAPRLVSAAVDMISSLIRGLISALPQMASAGIQIVTSLISGLTQALPMLLPAITSAMLSIVQSLTDSQPMLLDTGIQLIVALVEGLQQSIVLLIEQAPGIVASLVEAILTAIPVLADAAVGIIDGLSSYLVDNLGPFIDAAFDIINSLADGIFEAIPELVDAAVRIILALVDFVLDNIDQIIDLAVHLILTINSALIKAIPTLVEAALQIILRLVEYVLTHLPELIALGVDLLLALIEGLIKTIPDLLGAAGELIAQFFKVFTETDWGELGRNIVDGLVTALKNGISRVTKAAKELAESAWTAAKDFLGIESPSKRFAYLGEMSVEGYEQAIEDGEAAWENALSNSMRNAIAAADAQRYQQGAATAAAITNNYGGDTTQSGITIEKIEVIGTNINNDLDTSRVGRRMGTEAANEIRERGGLP